MSNKSGTSEQIISLPQGGGARHDIGEKFLRPICTLTMEISPYLLHFLPVVMDSATFNIFRYNLSANCKTQRILIYFSQSCTLPSNTGPSIANTCFFFGGFERSEAVVQEQVVNDLQPARQVKRHIQQQRITHQRASDRG